MQHGSHMLSCLLCISCLLLDLPEKLRCMSCMAVLQAQAGAGLHDAGKLVTQSKGTHL